MVDYGKKANKLSKEEISVLADSVYDLLSEKFDKLQASIEKCASEETINHIKANVRTGKYELDRLEQYTRRENVRIHNFKYDENAPLLPQTVELFNKLKTLGQSDSDDYTFTVDDISACHPTKSKQQIIVRFVSRAKLHKLFSLKKFLKKSEVYKNVFITEDMTQLRVRLLHIVKKCDDASNVYTRDGNIHCTYQRKHMIISSPDDLFDIGIEADLKELGLEHLI